MHAQAIRTARRAQSDAGVRIFEPATIVELAEVSELLDTIWTRGRLVGGVIPLEMLRAMTHAGNPVHAARANGRVVGVAAGVIGLAGGHLHVHSHVVGVAAELRTHGVGYALKLRQREWALERRIETIVWTFDPLVAANASFNLTRLAAEGVAYHVDFYGTLADAFQQGETDRIEIRWELASDAVVAAAEGERRMADLDGLTHSGARVILDVEAGNRPVRSGIGESDTLLARIPSDILGIRQHDPPLAEAWLAAVRETIGAAMLSGFRVIGFGPLGWYVLSRDDERNAST